MTPIQTIGRGHNWVPPALMPRPLHPHSFTFGRSTLRRKVEIQIFSDAEHTLPLLQNRARFKVLDTSHFPFDGFPYPDHLYAQFSGTFSSDTNGLDFDLENSDFYDEIWDRWSGIVTGSQQRELIWQAYSTKPMID